jgi:excisionase family DNA binding protein
MQVLLTETPDCLTSFRRWAHRAIAELTARVEGDTRGPLNTEQHAETAELIRHAKLVAFQLGLLGLCDRLPARDYKTAIDAILRLREVVEWHEPAPSPRNGQPFTVRQAADFLGISERVTRDLIASGELSSHRVGNGRGRIRIMPRDLEAYRGRTEAGFSHLFR